MLRSLKDLEGYQVSATDGDLGKVGDFLLEDAGWATRYLVVDSGTLFDAREVLISPIFFRKVDWAEHRFHLALSREKIRDSPAASTDLPVSRQHEKAYYRYFDYPDYWGGGGLWGRGAAPGEMAPGPGEPAAAGQAGADPHLRSASGLRGYHVHGQDEEIGHVEDFIVDDVTWQIRYLVINTSNWWVGRNVLVSPLWATSVDWNESMIHLDLTRERIRDSPEWHGDAGVNRVYEERLFDYYGRPVYWDEPGSGLDPSGEVSSSIW